MPIDRNGLITQGTLQNLVDGLRSKPMRWEAVDAVMRQTADFAQRLVDTYSSEIAAGEVGAGATGRASQEPIVGERAPRVLLYGRVQSGKTVAMILTAALSLDNGFRVVVVLTSDSVALVQQTALRFKALDGPRVFAATKEGRSYEWEGQEEQLRASVATDGLVLVCAKNAVNLPRVIRFLREVDAYTYPVLVMDDEADAATPDTTAAARSAAKPNAPAFGSTINRLVIENDDPRNEGFSLGQLFPHSLYIQVTATPFVLLLQRSDGQMRPTVKFLLEPGEGYCGGEVFFGEYDTDSPTNPQPRTVVVIGDGEAALMARRVPSGLAASIDFFILSACARAFDVGWPRDGFKHLSHTSPNINDHDVVANHISSHLNDLRTIVRDRTGYYTQYFSTAYTELQRSLRPCPSLDELIFLASGALRQSEVLQINSAADIPVYGPRLNFLVGGNILGRGLTIDDLLVTYYIREAKISQMDTVWQHARMYGYRTEYIDYVRIYLPHRLGVRFKDIHEAEELLRQAMNSGRDDIKKLLIRLPRAARPTRLNVLEAGVPRTIAAARDQIHPYLLEPDADAAATVLRLLTENNVPIGVGDRQSRTTVVPFEIAVALVQNVVVNEDDEGLWHEDIVLTLMNSYEGLEHNGCNVYVRGLRAGIDPPPAGWTRGRLSGDEIALIRAAAGNTPGLALLYQGDAASPHAWYPTLVLPPNAPAFVFSNA